jgi:hypothetical protein
MVVEQYNLFREHSAESDMLPYTDRRWDYYFNNVANNFTNHRVDNLVLYAISKGYKK